MKRILEPELMVDDDQARAYAKADFAEAHDALVEHFRRVFAGSDVGRYVLDLGCGPGDVSIRFARAYPHCVVHGVDGAEAMLSYGPRLLAEAPEVDGRVELFHGMLPGAKLPRSRYDTVISNSLLHHLPDPQILWTAVKHYGVAGAPIFVMDLIRPESPERARELVETYAREEPKILQRDFHNSLLAAFEIEEIGEQLDEAGLAGLMIERVSDRHVIVAGNLP